MSDKLALWMDSTAAKLRGSGSAIIDIEALLNVLEIKAYFDRDDKRSGMLTQGKDGKWSIIIRGGGNNLKWTPTDRFTAAHELGHYFLMNQWGISSSYSNKREYYNCEQLCNRFAARLLVDYLKVEMIEIASPKECLGNVRYISELYNVSKEVAARSIVETHVGIGICGYNRTPLGWYRLWGLASLNGVRKSNRKPNLTKSIEEEMFAWGVKQLNKKNSNNCFQFATESITPLHIPDSNADTYGNGASSVGPASLGRRIKIELSAIMVELEKSPVIC